MVQLEAALVSLRMPRDDWRQYVHSQVTLEAKEKIMHLLTDNDSTYDDIRAGLLGYSAMSFAAIAGALFGPICFEGDKPKLRQITNKVNRWARKLMQDVETITEAADKVTIAYIRSKLHPDLKTYMDLSETCDLSKYLMRAEEWERSHPEVKNILRADRQTPPNHFNSSHSQAGPKHSVSCFCCGKQGHISRECWSKIADERQGPGGKQLNRTSVTTPQTLGKQPVDKKPVVCFTCHQVGHKSPSCPKRQQAAVKRIGIPIAMVKKLKHNEVFTTVAGVQVPTTVDSGADRSVISAELVPQEGFTDKDIGFNGVAQGTLQAKLANVCFRIAGVQFQREALAPPGEQVFWTAALNLDLRNPTETQHLLQELRKNKALSEEEAHYMPPKMVDGNIQGAIPVSEGTLILEGDTHESV